VAIIGLKFSRRGAEHIVRRQRSPDTLQRKLTNRLNFHGILNSHQHTGTDQDLPRLGFVAERRGNIGRRPDCGIVEATLKTDGARKVPRCIMQ
jgi:hypothetical protein